MTRPDSVVRRFLAPQTYEDRSRPVGGLVVARVVAVEDDGTYRLHLFGMSGQDDDDRSAPARVMAPMAGNGRGMHFFPEVDDEVVVGFQYGDPNSPIILGGVWNKDAPAPDQARQSADNDVRTIVSRSGHELTFDDASNRGKITLRTSSGHQLELNESAGELKVTLETASGRSLVLDDTAQKITLSTLSAQISMQEPGQISIEASVSISLNAPSISINGTTVTLASSAGTSMIDNMPFLLHHHLKVGPTPPVTGPVTP